MLQSRADFSMLSTILQAIDNDLNSRVANSMRSKIMDIAIKLSNAAASIEDEATAVASYRIASHLIKECEYTDSDSFDAVMAMMVWRMVWRVDKLSEYADELFHDYGWPDHAWDVIHGDIDETVEWAQRVRNDAEELSEV